MNRLLWLCCLLLTQTLRAEHLTCSQCPPGSYCFDDNYYACPAHSTSIQEADNITFCICQQGYYQVSNHSCLPCEAGYYCSSEVRHQCPSFSTSSPLSTTVDDCQCVKGYSGDTCSACAAGTYKNLVSDAACTPCPNNTYSTNLGATNISQCSSCPENSQSTLGSSSIDNCICDANYERFQDTCIPVCPVNSARSVAGGPCLCNKGYTGADGEAPLYAAVCTICPLGYFKDSPGSAECSICPENTYADSLGSTNCTTCHDNSESSSGSESVAACLCLEGYALVNGLCEACLAGKFKSVVQNVNCQECSPGTYSHSAASTCSNCSVGTYQHLSSQSSCATCTVNSTSVNGSTGCLCVQGFTASCTDCQALNADNLLTPEATCSACPVGYVKTTIGNDACDLCAAGKYTLQEASDSLEQCVTCPGYTEEIEGEVVCQACPTESSSLSGSTSISDCKCNAGYTGTASAGCQACESGKYKFTTGSVPCSTCPAGSVGIAGVARRDTVANSCQECGEDTYASSLTVCTNCPINTQAPAGSSDVSQCICKADFYLNVNTCEACPPGSVKTDAGNQACSACAPGSYENNNACSDCPDFSHSAEGSQDITACLCNAGYTGPDGGACTACLDGHYKSTTGSSACSPCSSDTYQAGEAPYITASTCLHCPGNSTSLQGSAYISDCVCLPGFIRNNNACRLCVAGNYCPAQNTEIACAYGSFSLTGSDDSSDCICQPGYYGERNNCSICPANHYCAGDDAIELCPGNSTTLTLAGQTNITGCVCNAGFYEENAACKVCPPDHYCASDQQTDCPVHSSSLKQQGYVARCVCDEYYQKDTSVEDHCVLCGSNLVCHGSSDGLSDGLIETCAPNSTNVNQRCVCEPGMFCGDGLVSGESCSATDESCALCTPDHYCNDNMKYACDANSTSPAGSFNHTQCVCKPGYYRTLADQCLICPEGSFCVDEVKTDCLSFDLLTTDGPGHDHRDDCICQQGYFRINTTDMCKLCPANVYCPSQTVRALPNIVPCQENEYTSGRGSYKQSQCICQVGFYLNSELAAAKCMPCGEGERCSLGEVVEEFCHLENRTASQDHSECVCLAGFEENVEYECSPCHDGYYKTEIGNQACSLCPYGFTGLNTTACTACPANSTSTSDRLQCSCNSPYTMYNGQCVLCAENEYRSNGLCHACPAFSSTLGALGEEGITSCHCNPGYVFTDNLCIACPTSTYEHNGVCENCGEGAWSPAASSSSAACQCNSTLCQQFVWGDDCLGTCEDPPESCTACVAGHFKPLPSAIGNTDLCQQCPADTFQPSTGQASCLACDSTRMTLQLGQTSIESCVCRSGYEEPVDDPATSCAACAAGYFKTDPGNFACQACVIGTFTPHTNSTTCLDCWKESDTAGANTTVSDASDDVSKCVCDRGRFQSNQQCTLCVPGTYKDAKGMQVCDLCGVDPTQHMYGAEEEGAVSYLHCQSCPEHSGQDQSSVNFDNLMNELSDCLCFPAHSGWTVTACSPCPPYQYKIGYSNDECVYCADGYYFVDSNQVCSMCELLDSTNTSRKHTLQAVNSANMSLRWGQDQSDCVCDLGYVRSVDTCYPCAVGTVRGTIEQLTCTACEVDFYQDEEGTTACKRCPVNSHTNDTAKTDITDCLCDAGFELHTDGIDQGCVPCPAGYYALKGSNQCQQCPQDTYSLANAAVCTACAANERSLAGSVNESACNCLPGFGGPTVCATCPNNTYSPGGIPVLDQRPQCLPCPNFKLSPLQSDSPQDCVCQAGYEDVGSDPLAPCTPCIDGQYSTGGANVACKLCGFGTITEPSSAATAFDNCQCSAGLGLYEV